MTTSTRTEAIEAQHRAFRHSLKQIAYAVGVIFLISFFQLLLT